MEFAMQQVTSADAQNRFGQLLDMAQREPVAITRHGRTAGYVVSVQDMALLTEARGQREQAVRDLQDYWRKLDAERPVDVPELTEDEIAQVIAEVRAERKARRP